MYNTRFSLFVRQWWPIGLLTLIVVCVNSAVFFGQRTLIPFTIFGTPYGYKGPIPDWTTGIDPAGAFNVGYAFDAYTVRSLKEGIIPFWNPYQGLGQPFLANGLSAVLYPPNWLHFILPPAWWDVVYLLNWLLAAVFLYSYLRLVGIEIGASLVAGAAIFGSGFFQFYLALREVPAVAAWWPLLLYGMERTIREPNWRARHWVLAFAVYCSITGGQVEVTFLSLFAALVYALMRLMMQPKLAWRRFIALAPGSLAGLLLSAPFWISFADYAFVAYSVHPADCWFGKGAYLDIKSLITYFFPYIYGRVHTAPYGQIPGWNWILSPGWFPAVGLFLALVSVSTMRKKTQWGFYFLLAVAILSMTKIWGIPGINLIGSLPFFNRIIFPRYGAFLPAFSLAGLAAYGIFALSKLEARRWMPWLGAWFILISAILIIGILPIWPALKESYLMSDPSKTLVIFGALGMAWATLGPMGLWWVRYRHPEKNSLLFSLAAFAILFQGVAYASNGYSFNTYGILSSCSLGIYLLVALVIGLLRKIQVSPTFIVFGLVLVAIPLLCAAFFASRGLPLRYNPLKPAPYLEKLIEFQRNNSYRSYSLDSTPQPNFAAPFRLTSLDNLEALSPIGSAEFIHRYLDRAVFPIWFAGNQSAFRNPKFPALDEFFENKRYFDLVGVRYLVTVNTDPAPVLYERHGLRAYLPLNQSLEATFLCPTDYLAEIQVFLSTYKRTNPGSVYLSIFGPDGTLLRNASVPGISLRDNSFQRFDFAPIIGFKDQQLRLRLEFKPEQSGSMIAAWKFPDHPDWGFVFRVVDTTKRLPLVFKDETGVHIWENRQANRRVFLAPVAGIVSSWQDGLSRLKDTSNLAHQVWIDQGPTMKSAWPSGKPTGRILSFRLASNDVWIRYHAYTSGILTITDSYLEGWHAELNGQEVPVLCVDGAFRGVRIGKAGIYKIHFWYRPPYWSLLLGMVGAGLALVVGGTFLSYKEKDSHLALNK